MAIQNCWLKLLPKELQSIVAERKGGERQRERLRVGASAGMHHHVEIVSVRDYKVNPCLGCNACFKTDGVCAQKDDMAIIYEKMALLLVGAASLQELFDAILTEYDLCLKFFDIEDAGKVLVRGVKDKGDIKNTDALNEAYRLGCSMALLVGMHSVRIISCGKECFMGTDQGQ